ncbi:MAG: phospholipid/cholesterol/gamma-HCH transport system substrate-binding protein [Thermoleophilaceae bacterium]|jgi:virulence factor Mce-like protein|nr:phospholipid/cholesterol/gamma-HCH transport system substrate-binding protein [Thermoleophilaceae bacterium]
MQKQAPTLGKLAILVVFALSCLAILTYLWTSFGGATPLSAKGYRFHADFEEATQLADNADVRISGVTVGHVKRSEQVGEASRVEIEIEQRYAPIPKDTRATLRQKTLLGETYVELTPGSSASGDLPDGARLPATRIKPTVELDEILRAFDQPTRDDLQRFLKGTARAFEGRGEDVNAALGNLGPFAEDAGDLVRVLDTQRGAVRRLISDSGQVFESLGRRQGELSGLVRALDTLLGATARRNVELAETVRILPTTLRELRPTLAEVESLSREARPLVRDLRPAARALGPTLAHALPLAPELRGLFRDVDRVIDVSEEALPATTAIVNAAHPLFRLLDPVLQEAEPVVDYLGLYRQDIVNALAGVSAATQAAQRPQGGGPPIHYLRALVPVTGEGMVAARERFGTNRHNPYFPPGALDKLGSGLESFDCRHTGNQSPPGASAPPCVVAPNIEFQGRRTRFPQLRKAP